MENLIQWPILKKTIKKLENQVTVKIIDNSQRQVLEKYIKQKGFNPLNPTLIYIPAAIFLYSYAYHNFGTIELNKFRESAIL